MTTRWMGLLLIGGIVLFGVWIAPRIQTPVPLHSNDMAQVDLWATPVEALVTIPGCALGLFLIALILRRGQHTDAHAQYLDRIAWLVFNLMIAMLGVMFVALLGRADGWVTEVRRAVVFAFGLALMVMSYYLPYAQSKEWVGIRTPWTLADERIWGKTHLVGRWMFLWGGIMICCAAWLSKPYRRDLSMAGFMIAVIVPIIASYCFWRREYRAQE